MDSYENSFIAQEIESSEEILQRLRLLGDSKVPNVEERQNEIRLIGQGSKDFSERNPAGSN